MLGKLFAVDGKTTVADAVVTAVHLDSARVFPAAPTGKDGRFQLDGLPYGYYQIAVTSAGTVFALGRPVTLEPASKLAFDLKLGEVGSSSPDTVAIGEGGMAIPGIEQRATASATRVGGDKETFLKSKTTRTALIVGAALLILLLH